MCPTSAWEEGQGWVVLLRHKTGDSKEEHQGQCPSGDLAVSTENSTTWDSDGLQSIASPPPERCAWVWGVPRLNLSLNLFHLQSLSLGGPHSLLWDSGVHFSVLNCPRCLSMRF